MFNAVKSTMKKAEAAVVIQNLLDLRCKEGLFDGDPHKTANALINAVFVQTPHYFDGKKGQRPNKISYAASALALAINSNDIGDQATLAFMSSLAQILEEVNKNSHLYPLSQLDTVLLNSAVETFELGSKRFDKSPLGREMNSILEGQSIPPQPDQELISAEVLKLGVSDWEIETSSLKNELSRIIKVTTNYGVKTWATSFYQTKRDDGTSGLAFFLTSDVPSGGDDVGNHYPAIILVEGKPLVGFSIQLMSQGDQSVFLCDGEGLEKLGSFALAKLDGVFRVLGKDEQTIASFPWPADDAFEDLFREFSAF